MAPWWAHHRLWRAARGRWAVGWVERGPRGGVSKTPPPPSPSQSSPPPSCRCSGSAACTADSSSRPGAVPPLRTSTTHTHPFRAEKSRNARRIRPPKFHPVGARGGARDSPPVLPDPRRGRRVVEGAKRLVALWALSGEGFMPDYLLTPAHEHGRYPADRRKLVCHPTCIAPRLGRQEL